MIGRLRGVVAEIAEEDALIDVAGVGYVVRCGSRTLGRLPAVGDEALHVGRIRGTGAGLALLSVADNLRWGTVVPMVRVVELLREAERI